MTEKEGPKISQKNDYVLPVIRKMWKYIHYYRHAKEFNSSIRNQGVYPSKEAEE